MRHGNGGGINMRGGITTEMLEQRGLVWAERPAQTHVIVFEDCPTCHRVGLVEDGNGNMVWCPECGGQRMVIEKEYDELLPRMPSNSNNPDYFDERNMK